jgi:MFS transporter, ACDE family, multidrug resistance protein
VASSVDTGASGPDGGNARAVRGRSLWLLAAVPFLMVLGNSMLFPIFPKMQSAIGVSEMQTSLIVTSFSIPAGLLIPVAGYLSDRYGRRPIMAPGVALFGVGALMCGLAASILPSPYAGVIVGRVVQGMGAAAMSQLAMAMVADLYEGPSRAGALGKIEAANGFGKVVSPVSGGLVGLVAWFLPFYIFAALALPLAVAVWLATREPKGVGSDKTAVGTYVGRITAIFRDRGRALGSGLVAGGVMMFLLFGTLFFLSETLEQRFHVPELTTGLILAIPVAAMSVTSYGMGMYLGKRAGLARTAVLSGVMLLVAVMVVLALFHAVRPVLYGAIFCVGVGGGLTLPALNLLITSSAGAKERGLITSLYGAVRFFGVALGPPAFGLVMKRGEGLLFGLGAVVAALAFLAVLAFLSSEQLLGKGSKGERRPQRGEVARERDAPLRGGVRPR